MLDARVTEFLFHVLAFAYPGYLTYKTLEHDRKSHANARGWCIFWMTNAVFVCVSRVVDATPVSSVAFYRESKLAFATYLWHPRTRGALYVYDRVVAPFVDAHERGVDDVLARAFERFGAIAKEACDRCWAYARRSARNVAASASEASTMSARGNDAPRASGRAERVRARAPASVR